MLSRSAAVPAIAVVPFMPRFYLMFTPNTVLGILESVALCCDLVILSSDVIILPGDLGMLSGDVVMLSDDVW